MAKISLSYSDEYGQFLPIPGDKARRYINQATGEVIGVGKFQRLATRTEKAPVVKTPKSSKISTPKSISKPSKPSTPSQHPITRIKQIVRYESSHAGPIGKPNPLARYNSFLDNYVAQANLVAKKYGSPEITRHEARTSPEFKYHYHNYKNVKDRAKGGKRHQALIFFGILDEDDDYY